jgi:hypothetical protein
MIEYIPHHSNDQTNPQVPFSYPHLNLKLGQRIVGHYHTLSHKEYMRRSIYLLAIITLPFVQAYAAPSMETPSQPFDFDTYRRNPIRRSASRPMPQKGVTFRTTFLQEKKVENPISPKKLPIFFPRWKASLSRRSLNPFQPPESLLIRLRQIVPVKTRRDELIYSPVAK